MTTSTDPRAYCNVHPRVHDVHTSSTTPSSFPDVHSPFQHIVIEPKATTTVTFVSSSIQLRASSSRRLPHLNQTRQRLQHALDTFSDVPRSSNLSSSTLRLHGLRRAAAASTTTLKDFYSFETSLNTSSTFSTSSSRPQHDDNVIFSTISFSFFVSSLKTLENYRTERYGTRTVSLNFILLFNITTRFLLEHQLRFTHPSNSFMYHPIEAHTCYKVSYFCAL